jgi:hypothetical protein
MDKETRYMERGIIKPELKKAIFTRYSNKCYVCNYSVKAALRIHHIVPVSFGGKNEIVNFVLLCSNCHTLAHFYSSQRYQNKKIENHLKTQLGDEAINRLKELILKAQDARRRIKENDNLWTLRKPYTINEAVERIAKRNRFEDSQRKLLSQVIEQVLQRIPASILRECSCRLLRDGEYMSINLKNHLLFRTPAYGDFGEKPQFDCLLTFPKDRIPPNLKPIESRDVFFFRHFDCVNLGLSYVEILKLNENEWNLFEEACQMAQNARKTRNWISNIDITNKTII